MYNFQKKKEENNSTPYDAKQSQSAEGYMELTPSFFLFFFFSFFLMNDKIVLREKDPQYTRCMLRKS